ncbi:MAG: fructose-bisphosphatase class III [Candidatus Tectimicrobiota bacterium]
MAVSVAPYHFVPDMQHFTPEEIPALRALARRYPSIDAAVTEIAHLEALLHLPKGTVHIVSDVHGEHKKLQHILNNASGSLRPLVEELFASQHSATAIQQLLNTIYYPAQMFSYLGLEEAEHAQRAAFVRQTIRQQFTILAALTQRYSLRHVDRAFPADYHLLFRELLWEAQSGRPQDYMDTMLDTLTAEHKGLQAVRWASRVIRHLSVFEVVVAGDLGDRGPRLDKVIETLMHQPRLAMTWGNHDVSWMGACLGHEALIATVLRLSLRYRRLSQIEEGFGITMAPVEKLAREVYGDDPATHFQSRGHGLREALMMARMQKAMAIIQFKLEAQIMARHPEYAMQPRALMQHLDLERGVVHLDGKDYPLTDTALPTVDPRNPTALSPEESVCMARLQRSFLESQILWEQMQYVAHTGSVYLIRDQHLIFHGCVPVDEHGEFLCMPVDGVPYAGQTLFDALNMVVHRAFREKRPDDLDMLWYLWTGPLSPMFGKDRMATFETHFIADKATHKEKKNPYFTLIHQKGFCQKVLQEFGVDPQAGMIVNGHVPVMVEKGENPLKESHQAITIDGAFSEAYGDRGYTLILGPEGTQLAEHYHFESIEEALTQGADIIPKMQEIIRYPQRRSVGETESGDAIRGEITVLKRLIKAYQEHLIS